MYDISVLIDKNNNFNSYYYSLPYFVLIKYFSILDNNNNVSKYFFYFLVSKHKNLV